MVDKYEQRKKRIQKFSIVFFERHSKVFQNEKKIQIIVYLLIGRTFIIMGKNNLYRNLKKMLIIVIAFLKFIAK
jgi:hypothetical protein